MTTANHARSAIAIAVMSVLGVALLAPRAAHAQSSVEAEVMFREGKRLLAAGKVAEACDAFEASERLESTVGVLLNIADCRERNHQLATAWGRFLEAASLARRQDKDARREAEAQRRADLLMPRLSYLTVSVPDASRIEGLVVARDGKPMDPALWNQGVPVDQGTYEIAGSAPGNEPWSVKVTIDSEGKRSSVEVPRFKRIADLTDKHGGDRKGARAADAEPDITRMQIIDDEPAPMPPKRHGRFTTTRAIGLGLALVGVAAIGGGAGLAVYADGLHKDADAICPGTTCNDPTAIDRNDRAQRYAGNANIAFVTGGVAIAGGAALWFLGAPPSRGSRDRIAVSPSVSPSSVGLVVAGGF